MKLKGLNTCKENPQIQQKNEKIKGSEIDCYAVVLLLLLIF